MRSKVLLIGIDGATWEILKPMMDEGRIPNIKRLYNEGTSGILTSTIPPLTPVAFASFHTGVNPGKHGITDFQLHYKEMGMSGIIDSTFLKYKTFSEIANDQGKTIISINIPLTYPTPKLNGVVIGDFLAPRVYPGLVHPTEIYHSLIKKADYKILGISLKQKPHLSTDEVIRNYIDVESVRYSIAKKLMNQYDWDLFLIHNQLLDSVQHGFFHFLDKRSSHYSDEKYNIVAKYYESMDKEIGNLLENIDANTTVVLFSDHGFKLIKKNVHINSFLRKRGYFAMGKKKRLLPIGKIVRFIQGIDSKGLRYKMFDFLGIDLKVRRELVSKFKSSNDNNEKSQAFMRDGAYFGNIYLNRKLGDSENVGKHLIEALSELKDPVTGDKIVAKSYISKDIFSGPYLDEMPYLFLEPAGDYAFATGDNMDELITDIDYEKCNSGGHALEGIVVVWGKNVRSIENIRCHILNIAPTVLAVLGIAVPAYMDGKALEEPFYEKPIARTNSSMDGFNKTLRDTEGDRNYTSDDKDVIKERLKDLGYL